MEAPIFLDWQLEAFYFDAFFTLSTCRPVPALGGVLPIPWSAVVEYAERLGFDEETTDDFWQIMRVIDAEHCKQVMAKMPKPKSTPPPEQPKTRFGRRARG